MSRHRTPITNQLFMPDFGKLKYLNNKKAYFLEYRIKETQQDIHTSIGKRVDTKMLVPTIHQ